jgi:quercetin dioxygenase-like cupin family protein
MEKEPTMTRQSTALATLIAACFVGSAPLAQAAEETHVIASPATVKWGDAPPSFPKGAQLAVLHGDPGKAGPFALYMKMPAGYKIPAHWHSQDENLVIVSGTFYAGMGDKLDEKKAQALKAGSYVFMPAKMHHYAFAKSPAVVELHGTGPFDITYIDPKDDPQKK